MKFKSCTAALFYNLPEGNRDVAQLVAHYVRDVGVVRSSRIIPTKTKRGQLISWPLLVFYSVLLMFTDLNRTASRIRDPRMVP